MKNILLYAFFFCLLLPHHSYCQVQDSVLIKDTEKNFKITSLIIPSVLLTYGIVGLESHSLKLINEETKEEVNEHIDSKITVDDFSQYAPFVSVYALNAMGVKGRHNLKDRTIILGTAYAIMGSTVNIIKYTSHVKRPDGSSNTSFPSGHTATAFMGAEFLYQEYKDISIWYGIAGYVVATGTGLFRIYNDRHWITDVAAGAGIGILSTKIAYWMHPIISNKIFKTKREINGMILPYYKDNMYGLGMAMRF